MFLQLNKRGSYASQKAWASLQPINTTLSQQKVWNASNLLQLFPFNPGKMCYLGKARRCMLLLRYHCIASASQTRTDMKQTRNRYAITGDSYFGPSVNIFRSCNAQVAAEGRGFERFFRLHILIKILVIQFLGWEGSVHKLNVSIKY